MGGSLWRHRDFLKLWSAQTVSELGQLPHSGDWEEMARGTICVYGTAGTDSQPSLRWRLVHLGDTCTPVDPATLPGRLAVAGFTRVTVEADRRLVRFVGYTPGTEAEAPA